MTLTLNLVLDFPTIRGLVTSGKGDKVQVLQAFQYKVQGWDGLDPVLTRISHKLPKGVARLRLALSDRRLVHGHCDRPDKPKNDELARLLQDSVRKIGLFSEGEDLVIGYQDSILSSGGWSCRFLGAPESVLRPLYQLASQLGIETMQVTSIENVLAQAIGEKEENPLAILEIGRSNARILLAQGGIVLASRLVRLSLMDQGDGPIASDLLLPLTSEVYRSLEYFSELGHPDPEKVLVAGPLAHALEEGETWEGVLGRRAELFHFSFSLKGGKEGFDPDAYLSTYLLARMHPKQGGIWLVDTKRKSKFDLLCFSAAMTGLVALVFGASLSIKALHGEGKSRRLAKARMERNIEILKIQAQQLRADRRTPKRVRERKKIIEKIRGETIPLSRALATLAKEKPQDLHLVRMHLQGKSLRLEGFIDSKNQLGAIRSFGKLDGLLSAFAGGASGGGELGEPDKKNGRTPFLYEVSLGRSKR
ncbi:MAG TPA: hypothetical protein ENK02_01210 [Planctomycetes bacterium]|nr:hypothetical protein [Planctomycetota bacterium]